MKKYINYFIITVLWVTLCAGCAINVGTSESSDVVTSKSNTIEHKQHITNKDNNFRIYTDSTGSLNEFDNEILENQLDKDYQVELQGATTTQDFVEVETKYIDKWKVEIQNTVTQLKGILNDTDFNEFQNSQNQWENQLLNSTKSDWNIIQNKEYGIFMGTSFHWMWLSNIREQYRERAIHIKYMINLLQTKGEE